MKSNALYQFRSKLQADEPVYGVWVTLEAAAITDIAAGLGLDWIVIDAANGILDWQHVLEHIRATARSETVALVRLVEGTANLIERALRLGADGVLIPCPQKPDQLQSVIQQLKRTTDFALKSHANALVVPIIDSTLQGEKLREFITVDGVELFFFESPVIENCADEVQRTLVEIRSQKKQAGVMAASDEDLSYYLAGQFRVLGVGSDAGIILRSIRTKMEAATTGRKP